MSTRGAAVAAGYTVDELAERWGVIEKVASSWLNDFVRTGFVVCDGDVYRPTVLALRVGAVLGWRKVEQTVA
jgi:DNA-binding IclR family transcriptional regulator